MQTHRTSPAAIWIELTSRCPLRCVFCSRETLRGAGEDLSLDDFARLLADLRDPEIIRLNYSGESGNYPGLLEAIRMAKGTSAQVEMVTSLVSTPIGVVERLAQSGIDRISISLHSLEPEQFTQIYGAGSLDQMQTRIRVLQSARGLSPRPCVVDFAAVVMRENVSEIPRIAAFAAALGAPALSLHPVIRRPGVPYPADFELLNDGSLTKPFHQMLDAQVTAAQEANPGLAVSVARPLPSLNESTAKPPRGPFWCEQNPFDTAHILANGDVVPCEVLDRRPLGNLREGSFSGIWNGAAYTSFRNAYAEGTIAECAQCIFRRPTETVGPLAATWGWYPRDASGALWSGVRSAFQCDGNGADSVTIRGLLPPGGGPGIENHLKILRQGRPVACATNQSGRPEEFELSLPVRGEGGRIHFTAEVDRGFSPWRLGLSGDTRTLGFALYEACISSEPPRRPGPGLPGTPRWRPASLRERAADMLLASLHASPFAMPAAPSDSSLSVIVPERGSPDMLDECLTALRRALGRIAENAEVVAIVNGVPKVDRYADVSRRHADCLFIFQRRPLGFSSAISEALGHVSSGWTYLLNSDALPEEEALAQVLRHRAPDVFSVASRLIPAPGSASRETNYTAIQLVDGLANLVELDPPPAVETVEHAYAGGGSSLFQTGLLRVLAERTQCYDPFYWEDAEWGVAARSIGMRCLFAPASRVRHKGRATVSRFYTASEINRIFERNRIQFQMRCLPDEDTRAIRTRIVHAPMKTVAELLRHAVIPGRR